MAALVACFACQLSDRLGWAASAQAVASGRPVAALLGVALALAVANALAGGGAALIAPLLTPMLARCSWRSRSARRRSAG